MSHLSFSGKKWVLPDAPVVNDEAPLAPWLMAILNSRGILEADIPVIGHIEFVTSTIFDIGVYLVVIGLVLDVLRSLGAEVDRQTQELRARGVSVQ